MKDDMGRLEEGLHSMYPETVCDVLFPGPFLLCVMLPLALLNLLFSLTSASLPSSTPQASMTFTCPSTVTWQPL